MCFLHDFAADGAALFALGMPAFRHLTGRLRAVRILVRDHP
jgi:hypothetical protein